MGLDVDVLGGEQLLRARDRESLDVVHDMAATVITPPGVALRVFVGEHGARDRQNGFAREVFRRDQLELRGLALGLTVTSIRNLWIRLTKKGQRVVHSALS